MDINEAMRQERVSEYARRKEYEADQFRRQLEACGKAMEMLDGAGIPVQENGIPLGIDRRVGILLEQLNADAANGNSSR